MRRYPLVVLFVSFSTVWCKRSVASELVDLEVQEILVDVLASSKNYGSLVEQVSDASTGDRPGNTELVDFEVHGTQISTARGREKDREGLSKEKQWREKGHYKLTKNNLLQEGAENDQVDISDTVRSLSSSNELVIVMMTSVCLICLFGTQFYLTGHKESATDSASRPATSDAAASSTAAITTAGPRQSATTVPAFVEPHLQSQEAAPECTASQDEHSSASDLERDANSETGPSKREDEHSSAADFESPVLDSNPVPAEKTGNTSQLFRKSVIFAKTETETYVPDTETSVEVSKFRLDSSSDEDESPRHEHESDSHSDEDDSKMEKQEVVERFRPSILKKMPNIDEDESKEQEAESPGRASVASDVSESHSRASMASDVSESTSSSRQSTVVFAEVHSDEDHESHGGESRQRDSYSKRLFEKKATVGKMSAAMQAVQKFKSPKVRDPQAKELPEQFQILSKFAGGAKGLETFKWLSLEEAKNSGLPLASSDLPQEDDKGEWKLPKHSSADALVAIPAPWSAEAVRSIIEQHTGQEMIEQALAERLSKELATGMSSLVSPSSAHGNSSKLWRVAELVSIVIWHPQQKLVLVQDEAKTHFTKEATDFRKDMKKQEFLPLPGTLHKAGESVLEAAERALKQKVKPAPFSFKGAIVKTLEEEEAFGPYQDILKTRIRRHLIQCLLIAEEGSDVATQLTEYGAEHSGQVYYWKWQGPKEMPVLAKHRNWLENACPVHTGVSKWNAKASQSLLKQPFNRTSTRRMTAASALDSDDVSTVLPWSESAIENVLQENNSSVADMGMSLAELSTGASSGLFFFARQPSGGPLLCVSNTIVLRIVSANEKAVLVNLKGSSGAQWLEHKKALHESPWDSARWLVRNGLQLEDAAIEVAFEPQFLDVHPMDVVRNDEHHENPALVEQRWLVTGRVPPGLQHLSSTIYAQQAEEKRW